MATRKAFSYLLISTGVLILIVVFVFMVAMQVKANPAPDLIGLGKQIFHYDTFGDEDFWGETLKLHEAIEGAQFGGGGLGVSPSTALVMGRKVDVQVKLNSVVSMTVFFNNDGNRRSISIQCALCHSTMDDAYAPGIGERLVGWANRDLNVGAIVALSPDSSYRTTPLQGLWTHTKGGFSHDVQFATLMDVVNHYDKSK